MLERDEERRDRVGSLDDWHGESLGAMTFVVGAQELTLTQLLARTAVRLDQPDGAVDADLAQMMDALLGGGVPALRLVATGRTWLQYGVSVSRDGSTRFYSVLADTARDLLGAGAAEEFFFMHKPPGLRLRFQVRAERRRAFDDLIRAQFDAWRDAGLVVAWEPAVYEPESYLFGGPTSMRSVHRIFTADSLAWLSFHSQPQPPGPSWAMSLSMIRALFDALRIAGWEDLDVWDRLRWQAGRSLEPDLLAQTGQIAATIHGAWNDPERLRSLLGPQARAIAETYAAAVAETCQEWYADYFSGPGALVGPREAAAFMVVFHWNRADLSAVRQSVIAEALAARPGTSPPQP